MVKGLLGASFGFAPSAWRRFPVLLSFFVWSVSGPERSPFRRGEGGGYLPVVFRILGFLFSGGGVFHEFSRLGYPFARETFPIVTHGTAFYWGIFDVFAHPMGKKHFFAQTGSMKA